MGIAGCFGVPFSITGSGAGLETMTAPECQLLAARADPLKVRLEAEEILSGFHEASITWPPNPNPLPPSTSSVSASHTRVCFTNRILYRSGGSSTITCNGYSSPASKMSHSNASRPVVTLPHYSRHRQMGLFHTLILFVSILSLSLQICSFVVNSPPPPTTVSSSQDAVHRSSP